jgi:hypothetical protein
MEARLGCLIRRSPSIPVACRARRGSARAPSGKLLYRLAQKRCRNYKTCGSAGESADGDAYVNLQIFSRAITMQRAMQSGDCESLPSLIDEIAALMSIPFVQGMLRYAYKVRYLSGGSVERAEMAVFAAAVLPRLAHCNESAAEVAYSYVNVNSASVDFQLVRAVFEQNYACLNISCEQIGGLWYSDSSAYAEHFAPCVTGVPAPPTTSREEVCALAVLNDQAHNDIDQPILNQLNSQPALLGGAIVFACAALAGLCCFAALKLRSGRGILRLSLSIFDLVTDALFLSEVALLHSAYQSRGCTVVPVVIVLCIDIAALGSVSVLGSVCIVRCLHADKEHIDGAKLLRYLPLFTALLMLSVFDMEVTSRLGAEHTPHTIPLQMRMPCDAASLRTDRRGDVGSCTLS